MRLALVLAVLTAAACRFDGGGVGPDDDDDNVPIDGAAGDPDGPEIDGAPVDTDGDGVDDDSDNCPAVPNQDQYDEDTDLRGDACDGCPHRFDPEQPDGDGDHVNDLCDPAPAAGGDAIVFFDGFHGSARAAAWMVGAGSDTWTVADDQLQQLATTREIKILYLSGLAPTEVLVETAVTFDEIPDSTGVDDSARSAGLVTGYAVDNDGARIAIVGDMIRSAFASFAQTEAMSDTAEEFGATYQYFAGALQEGRYVVRAIVTDQKHGVHGEEPGGGLAEASAEVTATAGALGLRTRNVKASYAYVVAFGRTATD
jgi:hypothetical protein